MKAFRKSSVWFGESRSATDVNDYDENSGILTYCNAGHNPPLVHRAAGSIEALLPTGAAIGLVEEATFSQSTTILRPGDRLVLYTDGVVESMDGEKQLFGQERLEGLLRENPDASARDVIGLLKARLQQFSGAAMPADDTTVIAISVLEQGSA